MCFCFGGCVLIFAQYLDRGQKPLGTKQVKPYVEPAARWMFSTYGALEKDRFITDKQYFATMLEQYQVCHCHVVLFDVEHAQWCCVFVIISLLQGVAVMLFFALFETF